MTDTATACSLTGKTCVPCEGGVPRLTHDEARGLLAETPEWRILDGGGAPSDDYGVEGARMHRQLVFADFVTLMRFVNRMAELAEEEGHHPDFAVSWATLDVTIWTHAIGGLSENDFILAAKIDALPTD